MDTRATENEKVDIKYFEWLGYKNINGSLIKEGFEGEIQYVNNNFWYCKGSKAIKKIVIQKDFNNIYFKMESELNKSTIKK